jgi:hypothetical protein
MKDKAKGTLFRKDHTTTREKTREYKDKKNEMKTCAYKTKTRKQT